MSDERDHSRADRDGRGGGQDPDGHGGDPHDGDNGDDGRHGNGAQDHGGHSHAVHGRDDNHSTQDHGPHDHGHGHRAEDATEDGRLALDRRIAAFRRWLHEWAHGLYHGMVEGPAHEKIQKEAEDVEDVFFFACFADAFGIPSPVSYYTVELLPYMAEEFEQWERRMWDRGTLLERKGQQYHFH